MDRTVGLPDQAPHSLASQAPPDSAAGAVPLAHLLEECRLGHEAAWQALYEDILSPTVPRWLRAFRLDPDTQAEVFQDFCVHLFAHRTRVLGSYRPQAEAQFTSWLFAVFRNFLRDWFRKEKRYRRGLELAEELVNRDGDGIPADILALMSVSKLIEGFVEVVEHGS